MNFFTCIREAIAKHFGDKIIGMFVQIYHIKSFFTYWCLVIIINRSLIALGGVVLMEHGKIKVHLIKPDLAKIPLKSEKELGNWLHFIELSSPLVGVGCVVSRDPVIIFD